MAEVYDIIPAEVAEVAEVAEAAEAAEVAEVLFQSHWGNQSNSVICNSNYGNDMCQSNVGHSN